MTAQTHPGAQFYPSCIQLEATSTGPMSFVSFPGAYNPSTPGVSFYVYNSELNRFSTVSKCLSGRLFIL